MLGHGNTKKLSGRELFAQQEGLFADAEDAMADYQKEELAEVDEENYEDEELPEFD